LTNLTLFMLPYPDPEPWMKAIISKLILTLFLFETRENFQIKTLSFRLVGFNDLKWNQKGL